MEIFSAKNGGISSNLTRWIHEAEGLIPNLQKKLLERNMNKKEEIVLIDFLNSKNQESDLEVSYFYFSGRKKILKRSFLRKFFRIDERFHLDYELWQMGRYLLLEVQVMELP